MSAVICWISKRGHMDDGSSRYPVQREDSALLIVDVQEKLAAVMADRDRSLVYANTNRLVQGCSVFSVPIVVTEQYPKGLGSTVQDIIIPPAVSKFEKITFDVYAEKAVAEHLSSLGRKTVIVTGMKAHICVFFTAMRLLDEGYNVAVVSDAVCSRNAANSEMALLQLRQSGALVLPAESILFSLAERGGTDQFRKISALVK